jgi:hypothetical protein
MTKLLLFGLAAGGIDLEYSRRILSLVRHHSRGSLSNEANSDFGIGAVSVGISVSLIFCLV